MSDRPVLAVLSASFLFAVSAAAQAPPPPTPPSGSSLSLARAVELALARSPEAAVASAEAEEARANARLAGAPFRPEAYATTTPGWSSGLPVTVAGQVPALAGVSVRTTLYDPSLRAEEARAATEATAREAAFARGNAAVVRTTVSTYARAAASRAGIDVARRALEAREAIFRHLTALKGEGRATDLEVSRADLDVLRAKQHLLDRTLAADLDTLELERLIDWPAGASLELSDAAPALVPSPPASGNLDAARAADPVGRALDRQIGDLQRAAQLQARLFRPSVVAEAQYLRLAAYSTYDQYFVKFKQNDFAVAVAVAIPLWTGGRGGDSALAARARLDRAEAARRGRDRDLELAVRRAEAELVRTSAQATIAASARSIAGENVRVARALAAEGRGGASDVELAEIAAAEAQEDAGNAEQAALAAKLALLELRGELPGAIRSR